MTEPGRAADADQRCPEGRYFDPLSFCNSADRSADKYYKSADRVR